MVNRRNIETRTEENVEIDEAIWTIETYMNYTYRNTQDADKITEYLSYSDSMLIDIPTEIDEQKLLEMYGTVYSKVKQKYDAIENGDFTKELNTVDVEYYKEEEVLKGLKISVSYVLKDNAMNKNASGNRTCLMNTFCDDDFWISGFPSGWLAFTSFGKCGAYSGSNNKNGCTEVGRKANLWNYANVTFTNVQQSQPIFTLDLGSVPSDDNPYTPQIETYTRGGYSYYYGNNPDHTPKCLDPFLLNFYLNYAKNVLIPQYVAESNQTNPNYYTFEHMDVSATFIGSWANGTRTDTWMYFINVAHMTTIPPNSTPSVL